MTAAQDYISTIVNVKPLDIFKEASGEFQDVFVVTKYDIFNRKSGHTLHYYTTGCLFNKTLVQFPAMLMAGKMDI